MIRVRGFSIDNMVYSGFLKWLNYAGINEDLLSNDEFKSLLNEYKEGLK